MGQTCSTLGTDKKYMLESHMEERHLESDGIV